MSFSHGTGKSSTVLSSKIFSSVAARGKSSCCKRLPPLQHCDAILSVVMIDYGILYVHWVKRLKDLVACLVFLQLHSKCYCWSQLLECLMRIWASLLCRVGRNHLMSTFEAIDSLISLHLSNGDPPAPPLASGISPIAPSPCCPSPRHRCCPAHAWLLPPHACLSKPSPGAGRELLTVLGGTSRMPLACASTIPHFSAYHIQ